MTRFKYAYNALVYYHEDVAASFERVAAAGYHGIELVGEPDRYSIPEINRLRAKHDVVVSSICSVWTGEARDLTSAVPALRRDAVAYGEAMVDLAAAVGAPTIIVGPSPVGKLKPTADPKQEWAWAIDGVRSIASYAESHGVDVTIEAWNRYETHLVNRLDQALALLDATGAKNAGVHGDMFHMNIEEDSIAGAYLRAGARLNHVHLADSDRSAPGHGHTDFRPVLKALDQIGFDGYLTFELLPASADPFRVMAEGGHTAFLDEYTRGALEYMRKVEAECWPAD